MTVLLSQTGSKHVIWSDGQTLTCYNQSELLKIANELTLGRAAIEENLILNQQLKISNDIIFAKNKALFAKDSVITNKDISLNLKEEIIIGKNQEINDLNTALKTSDRKLKWTKLKWGTTSLVLSAGLIYCLIR